MSNKDSLTFPLILFGFKYPREKKENEIVFVVRVCWEEKRERLQIAFILFYRRQMTSIEFFTAFCLYEMRWVREKLEHPQVMLNFLTSSFISYTFRMFDGRDETANIIIMFPHASLLTWIGEKRGTIIILPIMIRIQCHLNMKTVFLTDFIFSLIALKINRREIYFYSSRLHIINLQCWLSFAGI